MKFSDFSKILQKLEITSSRNEMTEILVGLLKKLKGKEIKLAMYLLSGRIAPRYIPLEFNVASKLTIRALAKVFKLEQSKVESEYKESGDLGLVAQDLSKQTSSSLDIQDVYQQLLAIASAEGSGSVEAKIDQIAELIKSCDKLSGRYVTRMILGGLRLGFSDKTVLDALSVYEASDKSKRDELDRAYGARSDIGFITEQVLTKGIGSLSKVRIEAGIPVASMNCEREKTFEKILGRMGTAIIQPKYDGLRCQIHYSKEGFKDEVKLPKKQEEVFGNKNSNVRLFSRNLENLTDMFPDILDSLEKLDVRSIILDSEVIGIDKKTGRFLPFQETIQRKRKYGVSEIVKSVPVNFFVFDLLYLNGKDISLFRLEERFRKLKSIIEKTAQDNIRLTPSDFISEITPFKKLFNKYVTEGLEGIIAKDTDSSYQPGKRGYDWIKLKKSAKGHLIDNVDTVVLGYYKGRGARAKFGMGAILVGVLNKKNNRFESIAKVGTGIKDDQWKEIKRRFEDLKIEKQPQNVLVVKNLAPDVWVKPEVVMVVDADEITTSPSHTAGFRKGRGYSLRFPRLREFDRKDKDAKDITTVKEVEEMYKMQKL